MPIALAPAVAAGAATGPLAPIAIPIATLLSAIFGRRLFGGGKEEGPQPYGVGEWTIKPGDPWYGQPIDPYTGLHQSLVDQIWNMAPPEGLPASMLQSNSSLGIPNWSALRLQRVAWELGGWNNLVDVLKSEPNVGTIPDWLTSRMSWGLNPLVDGTQGGNVYDMSDWLTFSTTVFGLPWGIINGEIGPIPEGQEPDSIDPSTGMPVYSTTVIAPQEPSAEPEFPGPPPSNRVPEEPSRESDRLPRFSTTVTAPMPTSPTPPPVSPPMPEPAPVPPVIPPMVATPNLPPPNFPGPPMESPSEIPPDIPPPNTPVTTPGPPPGLPNLGALAGLPVGGGFGPAPGGFPVIGGSSPYQTLFGLPIPQTRPVLGLASLLGGR